MSERITRIGREALGAAYHGVGQLTSGHRMLPGLLIVGAQRCGTTSMFKTLRQHPNVLAPRLQKGVHYFDVNYGHRNSWYRGYFPTLREAARTQRRTGAPAVTLESSPYYMFHPLAGERIARDLPQARLICLLRDPVERAYSAHAHESARGFETEPFERAVELEPERTAGARDRLRADPLAEEFDLQHHAYLARGQYVEQLDRLVGLVGRDRLHVVDSQDFFRTPAPVFQSVLDFAGLSAAADIRFEQHNARARPSPLTPELRRRLEDHFAPYDERLASWLGWTPSWRR